MPPIRIPDTPDLARTNSAPPTMDGRSPIADSIGNLAKSIGGIAATFAAKAEQIDKVDQAGKESEVHNQLAEAYAKHQQDLARDPDPASHLTKTNAFIDSQRELLKRDGLSETTRQRLNLWYGDFSTKAKIDAGERAARLTNQRAGLQFSNEFKAAKTAGDRTAYQDTRQRALDAGLLLPEKADALDQDFEQTVRHNESLADIASDPNAWLQENPADKPAPGYDMGSWSNLQSHAKQQLRAVTYDVTGKIQDGIVSGNITTPEQIDQLTPELRPAAREELKTALFQQLSAADKAARATPEYQAQTVGKVSALLADYTPASDSFDSDFVKIDSLTRTLPPGAVRDELERRVKDVREGKQTEIKTHADSANAALDAAFKAGRFGQPGDGTAEMPVARVINDGFLTDKTKLLSLGLTEDQVNAVASKEKDSERLAAFRALAPAWSQRQNITADGFTAAAAEAILNEQTQVKYQSPEAIRTSAIGKVEAQMKFGRAKTQLAEWIKVNPNASATEIDDQVFKIAGAETRRALQSGIFDPRPTMTPAAAGDRITSYGYARDSTPDTNSAAGIGAFVSVAEAEKIKAGEVTPNRLQSGDLAISRDIEAQFREAGIQPGQMVRLKLADGTLHTGRWMDRTADVYNGRTLTGRFDVYSPDGPSPLNDTRVIGWEPGK
jgi:hypothetical protein